MSSYITNKPFPVPNHIVRKDIVCPIKVTIGLNCSNITNPYCSRQLKARNAYLQLTNNNSGRATIFPGPYPKYTSTQLDIRRKSEILQYKKNAMTSTAKRNWVRLSFRRRQNSRVCVSRSQVEKSSTMSDVPFPLVDLWYDPNVPLYNYKPNPSSYNEYPYPDTTNTILQKIFNNNVNVTSIVTSSPILTMSYINEPSDQGVYTLTTPVSILLGGTYYSFLTDSTKAIANITSLTLDVTSIITGVVQKIIPLNVDDISDLSITFAQNGVFDVSFYIGPVIQNNIQLTECPQTTYNFTLRSTINIMQENSAGDPSTNPISIASSSVANVTQDSPFFNTQLNCHVTTTQPSYVSPSYTLNK